MGYELDIARYRAKELADSAKGCRVAAQAARRRRAARKADRRH
ncbi:MAG TPA: hypothetical protein VHW44_16985 [Pseudonocardiaceae bacterium]|jgi:hypothetical protein|nr:hypothetical protein [Pseudonocardiaceae bacterium]